jgi:phosphoribosylanthranilate isomerase
VAVEIKFCGIMRREDANAAAALGASYVGVIFAGGPRMLSGERAAEVLGDISAPVRRVGVFADQPVDELLEIAGTARLDVVQLHGAVDPARVREIRKRFAGDIWQVVRVTGTTLPESMNEIARAANGLLLDAYSPGTLGGTGVALPWEEIAEAVTTVRSNAHSNFRLILAGGLRPENVARAIAAISPDVVDVSSGVESAPGIKDHDRMRAFRDAVLHATPSA